MAATLNCCIFAYLCFRTVIYTRAALIGSALNNSAPNLNGTIVAPPLISSSHIQSISYMIYQKDGQKQQACQIFTQNPTKNSNIFQNVKFSVHIHNNNIITNNQSSQIDNFASSPNTTIPVSASLRQLSPPQVMFDVEAYDADMFIRDNFQITQDSKAATEANLIGKLISHHIADVNIIKNLNITSNHTTNNNISVDANKGNDTSDQKANDTQLSQRGVVKLATNQQTVVLSNGNDDQYIDVRKFNNVVFVYPKFPIQPIKKRKIYTEFQNFAFYHSVPLKYVEGQTFRFEGIITNEQLLKNKKQNKITMLFEDNNSDDFIACTQSKIVNFQFNISCQMKKIGQYRLFIFIGNLGKASAQYRNVVGAENLIKPSFVIPEAPQPKGLRLEIVNNYLYLAWDSRANLTNLTIYQQLNGTILKKQYLLSNNHERFKVPYQDFDDFLPITTYVEISHAMSLDATLSIINSKFTSKIDKIQFQAMDHAYDLIDDKLIITPQMPWRLDVDQKFKFTLSFNEPLLSIFYIIEPNLNLRKIGVFNQNQTNDYIINAKTPITFEISFSMPGTHIFEINDGLGSAILNRPFYVGVGYPLIPDYKDLAPEIFLRDIIPIPFEEIYQRYYSRTTQPLKTKQPPLNSTIEQKREYLLTLVNGLRRKYKTTTLYFDQRLEKIAQNHTDDMVLKNYISHKNKQGQDSKKRAQKFNFKSPIGENIGKTFYLTDNHLGLERSATHLQTLINKRWTRLGIGINRTQNAIKLLNLQNISKKTSLYNQYIITYEFSTRDFKRFPLNQEEQKLYREQLTGYILQKYPNLEGEDKKLSQGLKQWVNSDRSQNIYDYINKNKIITKSKYILNPISFELGYSQKFVSIIKSSNIINVDSSKYKYVGVGLGIIKAQESKVSVVIAFWG